MLSIPDDNSAAATAIVSVQAATGSIHAHLLMSGLLPQPNIANNVISVSNQQQVASVNPSVSNNGNNVVAPLVYPLEVKFESKDDVTGETRIIAEDLTLPSINNVIDASFLNCSYIFITIDNVQLHIFHWELKKIIVIIYSF